MRIQTSLLLNFTSYDLPAPLTFKAKGIQKHFARFESISSWTKEWECLTIEGDISILTEAHGVEPQFLIHWIKSERAERSTWGCGWSPILSDPRFWWSVLINHQKKEVSDWSKSHSWRWSEAEQRRPSITLAHGCRWDFFQGGKRSFKKIGH